MIALLVGFALATEPQIPPQLQERMCVAEEIRSTASELKVALETCGTRYHWTEEQKFHAANAFLSIGPMLKATRELKGAGVNMPALEQIYQSLSPEDQDAMGNKQETRPDVLRRLAEVIRLKLVEFRLETDPTAVVNYFFHRASVDRSSTLLVAVK